MELSNFWYGDVITAAVTATTLKTWLTSATEVKNSHQDTFQYTQDDPSVTDYINELTGKPYYRDMTNQGNKTIAFTIGEYAFEDKVALQGGKLVKETNTVVDGKLPILQGLSTKLLSAKRRQETM